uniref:Nup54 domain-containing protein n=1 Tax=Macrostomum lignano TaxID=282301 RepID=A0A1I8I9U2_9PLAT
TSGFGFAAPAASAATSGFAFPAPAGSAATSAPFGFGKPAGAAVSSAASFGAGFGAAGKLTLGAFGQTAAAPAGVATSAAASAASSVAFFASLTQPALFPDERDSVLARWNQLQAQWGAGKGFCSHGPVEYQPGNPFCRLKSVCYNALPAAKDEDGLVGLTTGVKDALFRLLGNKPNLTPHIEEIRALGEKLCQLVVYIREQLPTGGARRILSTELAAYLSQPMNKQQLSTQLQVTAVQA